MIENESIQFSCMRPVVEDGRFIFKLRKDPEIEKHSYHSSPDTFEEFYLKYLSEYFIHPSLPPVFILFDGERIGYIRLRPTSHPKDPKRTCADLSIALLHNFRGKHLGFQALKLIEPWLKERGVDDIVAEVKVNHTPSLSLFKKLGYRSLGLTIKVIADTGEKIKIEQFILTVNEKKKRKNVFVIAEAGSNWCVGTEKENKKTAFSLIEAAANAGVDAVKFQVFRSKNVYVPNAGMSKYLAKSGTAQDVSDLFQELEMPYEWIKDLAEEANNNGIEFMSSVFSPEDFAHIDPFVKRHKLASYEISHSHLIELMARSGKPLLMSTGCSTLDDIAWAVEKYKKSLGKDLTLLQCTASYPAPIEEMNIQTISSLGKSFHLPVGLSDHSQDPILAPTAAVALGATVIEKHFTLDRSLPGPDHSFAITPTELKEMTTAIRKTEQALGSGQKIILPSEEELYHFARRGIQATKNLQAGAILKEGENFAILRPGNCTKGAHPKYIKDIEGKKAKTAITIGEGIGTKDVE